MFAQLINISWNHINTEIHFRDKLALPKRDIIRFIQAADNHPDILEFTILSTCNRMEFYVVTTSPKMIKYWVMNQYNNLFKRNLEFEAFMPAIFFGRGALEHLFRVSSGMDSMVIGEKQILQQVQSVHSKILQNKEDSILLDQLFKEAVCCGESVRTKTKLGSEEGSMSREAVKYAVKFSPNITARDILIIGAGETAELTAKHFIDAGAKHITIINRNEKRGRRLADRLKTNYVTFSQIINILKDMDIVITATDSIKYLIKRVDIKNILYNENERDKLFIDISIPRNIDPEIRELVGVTLLDIDSLKIRNIEAPYNQEVELALAEEIVQFHVYQCYENSQYQQHTNDSKNAIHPIQLDH